ncbi:hypothetical protein ATANTOWER_005554 [Ataeniobius toweri]|uniref:Uncharacterized protein n=1 Tax=Ataeniobius toweri TaxID=208326 RepID=A0ABU7BUW5_9TELE|nr:hypothetical protein [Ataeniobius toweri]
MTSRGGATWWSSGLEWCPAVRRSRVLIPALGLSAWSLHVLLVHTWVLSRSSCGFPPQSKNITVRSIGQFKLPLDDSVCAWLFVLCVSVLPCVGLATCPGYTPPIAPMTAGYRHQLPRDPAKTSGHKQWMDGRLDGGDEASSCFM